MEHVASFLETVLWVGLIVWLARRYHLQIYGLLTAFQKRVETGSRIKAGWFELGDQLVPQTPDQQKERIESEIHEILQTEQIDPAPAPPVPTQVKSRFLVAEDLGLRAIQVEFQVSLKRQVAAGDGTTFDAVFTSGHQLHIVEVKYVVREKNAYSTVRRTLESFSHFLGRSNWHNVRILVAIVFEYDVNCAAVRARLEALALEFSMPVTFRCYLLSQLRDQFGASIDDNG